MLCGKQVRKAGRCLTSDNMLQQLPIEITRTIYRFDPTYHEIFKKVVHEVVINRELAVLFNGSLLDILTQPSLLQKYTKKDFEHYAQFLGVVSSRKLTRRRLLSKLVCYYLREHETYDLPLVALWVLS